jgi:hypothetical protein
VKKVGHRRVIQDYYTDVNGLAELLSKLINSYRLLIGGANELNGITLAHRGDVRDALKRVDKLGIIIDDLLKALEETGTGYLDYCKLKSEVIKYHLEAQYVQTEIDNELKLQE